MEIIHNHGVCTREEIISLISGISPGFFLKVFNLPVGRTVDCGLYGPSMGDSPVTETEVTYFQRSEDRPLSRMVSKPMRPIGSVVIIGVKALDDKDTVIYTCYGGDSIAPREPGDKTLNDTDRKESVEFWATHALSMG